MLALSIVRSVRRSRGFVQAMRWALPFRRISQQVHTMALNSLGGGTADSQPQIPKFN